MALFAPRARWRGADLRQAALPLGGLAGADLRACDLRGLRLDGVNLAGADLRGARLDGASLVAAVLADAELDGASLLGADASRADFRRTSGAGVQAAGLVAEQSCFDGAEWRDAVLTGANLAGVRGVEWRLDRAKLVGASLVRARLDRAVLDEADLDDADFEGARLYACALASSAGAARLTGADLTGADLRGAPLGQFALQGARLARSRVARAVARVHRVRLEEAGWVRPWWERAAEQAVGGGGRAGEALRLAATALRERARRAESEETRAEEEDPDVAAGALARERERLREADRIEAAALSRLRASRAPAPARPARARIWLRQVRGWLRPDEPEPDRPALPHEWDDFPEGAAVRQVEWQRREESADLAARALALRTRVDAERRAVQRARAAERAERQRQADEARRAWEAREAALAAEAAQEARLAREAEAARKAAEGARKAAEAAARAEEVRLAREAEVTRRAAEAAARAQEARLAREAAAARRAAEEARQAEEARVARERARVERDAAEAGARAEKDRRAAEARALKERQAEEARQKAAEARARAEEARIAEAAEQARRAEEARRIAEEARVRAEEAWRQAERERLAREEERAARIAETARRSQEARALREAEAAETQAREEAAVARRSRQTEVAAREAAARKAARAISSRTETRFERERQAALQAALEAEAALEAARETERLAEDARVEALAALKAEDDARRIAIAEMDAEERERARLRAHEEARRAATEERVREAEGAQARARAAEEERLAVAEALRAAEAEDRARAAARQREEQAESARLAAAERALQQARERAQGEHEARRAEERRAAAEAEALARAQERTRIEALAAAQAREEAARTRAELLAAEPSGLALLIDRITEWTKRTAPVVAREVADQPPRLLEALARARVRSRKFFDDVSERLPAGLQRLDAGVRESEDWVAARIAATRARLRAVAESTSRSIFATIVRAGRALIVAVTSSIRLATWWVARALWAGVRIGLGAAWFAVRQSARALVVALRTLRWLLVRAQAVSAVVSAAALAVAARMGLVAVERTRAGGRIAARGTVAAWRVTLRGAVAGARSAWSWLVGDAEEADRRPSVEESLDFSLDAEARDRQVRRARATEERRQRVGRAVERDRVTRRAAAAAGAAAGRDAGTRSVAAGADTAARAKVARAIRAVVVSAEQERVRAARAESRALQARMRAEAERARLARDAERTRLIEEAELARLDEAAREAEERAARASFGAARRAREEAPDPIRLIPDEVELPAAPFDDALLVELRARAAARRRAADDQAARVRDARVASAASARRRVDDGGRALAGAVRRGVSRLREAIPQSTPLVVGPGADLAGQRLDDRDLAGVDLSGANLRQAGLVGADLRGADLRRADLRDADLTAARLEGARFDDALLDGAILDQASVEGAAFGGASVAGARLSSARGLSIGLRNELEARGADTGASEDGSWARTGTLGVASAAALVLGIYLAGRFAAGETDDLATLEHEAAEASRTGDAGEAAKRFAALARANEDLDARITYLLEAASAAEEAEDLAMALSLLEEAVAAATDTGAEARTLLRLAQAHARGDLTESAATGFRELLKRSDLSPDEAAAAVTGFWSVLPEAGRSEALDAQSALLSRAGTDTQRSAVALALADGWSGQARADLARSVLDQGLALVTSESDAMQMKLRIARFLTDDGDLDGALAAYRALYGLPGGDEGRLGAADLLCRRGNDAEATALLAPLLASARPDLRSRALLQQAGIAERAGDTAGAVAALRQVLDTEGLESNMLDEARIFLARLDPASAEALVGDNPELRSELLLGRARALREAGKRTDARELWVEVAEDPESSAEARVDAELALADMEVEDRDFDGALRRYDALLDRAEGPSLRSRVSLGRANALLRTGRLQEAEAAYLAMLLDARAEVAAQCRLGLARSAELRGQAEKAEGYYAEVARSEGPWAIEALLSLGQLRMNAGNVAGAIESLRLARSRPGGETARRTAVDIALAHALSAAGDPAAADIYASLLTANDPEVRVRARLAVGDRTLAADPKAARELFEAALAEAPAGPERSEARAGWLRASVALGELDAGVARIEGWLDEETDPGRQGELATAAVRALREQGGLDDAERIADTYADAGGFELAMERAGALREASRPAEASAVLRRVKGTNDEDEAWRRELLADALMEAGDLDGAERVWEDLDGLAGGAKVASFGLARLAREKGDNKRALELLANSDDPRAPVERATALENLGRWEEAETAWRRIAVTTDLETRSAGMLGVARVRLAHDDPAGALAAVAELTVIDAGYRLTGAQIRGDALLALSRIEEATAVYAGLTQDAESRTVGALGLAECALADDDPATARSRFEQAFGGTSDRFYKAQALAGVARAWAQAGQREEAARAIARLREEFPEREDAIASAESGLAD